MRTAWTVLAALMLLAAACGGGDGSSDTTTSSTAPAPTTSTTAAPTTTTLPAATTSTTAPPSGDYGVVGVGPNEHLNVRSGAGTDNEAIGRLEFDARGVARTGALETVDGADWWEIVAPGVSGWVHSGFLDLLGAPVNSTDAYLLDLGTPTVATPAELIDALVASIESTTPDDEGTLEVKIGGILIGEPSLAVVEVTGFGDDSVGGEHLVVTMEPDDSAGWVITLIESSPRCRRGVTPEGLCS